MFKQSNDPAIGAEFRIVSVFRTIVQGGKILLLLPVSIATIDMDPDTFSTINLIDVLWLQKGTNKIISAFEVEKSTSIYSGILRLMDLSLSPPYQGQSLYLVAPNEREQEVALHLRRPSL